MTSKKYSFQKIDTIGFADTKYFKKRCKTPSQLTKCCFQPTVGIFILYFANSFLSYQSEKVHNTLADQRYKTMMLFKILV